MPSSHVKKANLRCFFLCLMFLKTNHLRDVMKLFRLTYPMSKKQGTDIAVKENSRWWAQHFFESSSIFFLGCSPTCSIYES